MSNINKQGRQVQRYANYGVDMMEWADGGYVKHSDYLALLDELEALQSFRTAYMEWSDKTDWVQTDKRLDVIKPWGKHRADVLKLYIDHLKSNLEAAEHTAAVDHEAACSLVEENEELKRKLEAAEQRNAELVHNHRVHAARLIDERGQLKQRIAELESRTVTLEPFRSFVTDADITALHRFAECCDDPESGGHDLEKEQVRRLEAIGALQRSGRISYITGFGDVLISITSGIGKGE